MKRGFTLIEMLVSVGLFSVAITIIMTSLFSITAAQRKAIAVQNAQDNLRFAFEAMTKDIRTGRYYYCGSTVTDIPPTNTSTKDCPFGVNGGNSFSYQSSVGQTVTYQIWNNQLVRSSDGTQPCVPDPNIISDCQKITSPNVVIVDNIAFYVSGSGGFDNAQSFTTIVLEGKVIDPRDQTTTKINLQTSVSRRGLTDQP